MRAAGEEEEKNLRLNSVSSLLNGKGVINSRAMKVETTIWDKMARVVGFLLFLAGLLGVAVWYLPLIKQNERMRKEILRLDAQIQKEEDTKKQLKTATDGLLHDPKTVERLAREKLGYAKPGETVIRFETPVTNQPRM